ncbi:hypothetical protein ACLM5H_00965 [Fredinandcohnia humi]
MNQFEMVPTDIQFLDSLRQQPYGAPFGQPYDQPYGQPYGQPFYPPRPRPRCRWVRECRWVRRCRPGGYFPYGDDYDNY